MPSRNGVWRVSFKIVITEKRTNVTFLFHLCQYDLNTVAVETILFCKLTISHRENLLFEGKHSIANLEAVFPSAALYVFVYVFLNLRWYSYTAVFQIPQ